MNFRKLIFLFVSLAISAVALAQQRPVKGCVLDDTGQPLMGAAVVIQGTATGVSTDYDGNFSISAAPEDKLVISFIGFDDKIVSASETDIRVMMAADSNFLNEIVVVGYGTQKKATLTGAVSAIDSKDIVITKNENVVNMLSGKIAGVRITQNSSQPGEFDNNIDIRGMGEPLIVVDGIPRDRGYFSRMDANEIDNVSVLKDASAAIYGVRAANGVILVTTKKGGASDDAKFDIDLSVNAGWQNFIYVPETSDAVTHMTLLNEKRYNAINNNYPVRTNPRYSDAQIQEYRDGTRKSTNWNRELLRDRAPQQQYNFSISGGSGKINYFLNLGYMNQMGSYRSGSLNYNRWNVRANVDAQITKRLRAGLLISGYKDRKNQPFSDSGSLWDVYKKAWTYRPSSVVWVDSDHPAYDSEYLEAENPVVSTDSDYSGYRRTDNYNISAALTLVYEIPKVDGLNIKAFYNYDYSHTNLSNYKRTYYLYSLDTNGEYVNYVRNTPAYVYRYNSLSHGNLLQLSINYAHDFAQAHHVSAMFLYEEQYNYWEDTYAQRNTNYDNEYLFAGEEDGQKGSMTGVGDKSRRSFIFHANYDYKGKYLLDFAFREDASSSFPSYSRWGFFPSISAGWRISEEPFLKNAAPWISNLKIRASWGRMGDDASAGTYPANIVGYNIDSNYHYGWLYDGATYSSGVAATSIPNLKLTWYTSDTYNAGIDWNFWKQKFGGTAEIFMRRRNGLLATSNAVIPSTVGAALPQENLESDMTYGYEIQLSHYNKAGDFNYYITAQMSATKNRWIYHVDTEAGNSMELWHRGNLSGRNKDIWFAYEEGGRFQNYEEIFYHGTVGANYSSNTLPGDYWYEDWNGDGVVDGNDVHPVATYNLPVFNYGLSFGCDWKGIDLSMNFQGAAGVYSMYSEVFSEVGPFDDGAVLSRYTDRWHTKDPNADPWNPNTEWVKGTYPATGHSFTVGSTGIKNTSYLRLKTLELGYTFPEKWMKKAYIRKFRVYFSAYNLFTISGLKGMDPERPGASGGASTGLSAEYNYPNNRTFNIGASIKF